MDPSIPPPESGRTFGARRRIRLSDRAADGRLRLDALARFLQDVAIDDVEETGWGAPSHLWFVRRIAIHVVRSVVEDAEVELRTWCSGMAAVAAGRRWSVSGDRGGRVEVDSVWIHLGPDQRPARLDGFGVYADATGGRGVSTKLELPDPPEDAIRVPWPLRLADVDMHGHVNNAVYLEAVEERLDAGSLDPRAPLLAELDYRRPLDLGDGLELAESARDGALELAFLVDGAVHAAARVSSR